MICLDSTAIVKLVHAEPQSQALHDWLDERAETGWISSVLAEIESFRALARSASGRYCAVCTSRRSGTVSPPGREMVTEVVSLAW